MTVNKTSIRTVHGDVESAIQEIKKEWEGMDSLLLDDLRNHHNKKSFITEEGIRRQIGRSSSDLVMIFYMVGRKEKSGVNVEIKSKTIDRSLNNDSK